MNTLSPVIKDVLENKNCELVRKAHNRRVYHHKDGFYVKVFDLSGLFAFFLLTRIKKEISQHNFLKNKGLSLPDFIGFERQDRKFFIVTKEINEGIVLTEYLSKCLGSDERETLLKSIVSFIKVNYQNGFIHNDLHFGNIIWSKTEQKFYFLDPKEIVYKSKVSYRKQIKNFALLYNSLLIKHSSFISDDWNLLAGEFCKSFGLDKYRKLLEKYRLKNFSCWLSKRTKRCFKVNRDFSFLKQNNYRGYYYNPVMEKIDIAGSKIVDFVLNAFNSPETSYLKNSNTTAVARIKHKDIELAVKRFNVKRSHDPYKNFFRRSRAYRSWYWGWRLNLMNLPVPEPVFFFEKRVMGLLFESYYAMNFETGSLNVMDYLNDHADELAQDKLKKQLFLRGLAEFVVKCNNARMCHHDFQLKNILVNPKNVDSEYSFKLIDLEAITLSCLSSSRTIESHLRQLKKSFLRLRNKEIFSARDILYFLKVVLKNERWDKPKLRRLFAN